MASEDYFDPYDWDDDQDEEARCKFCGKDGLHWVETQDGYRLFTKGGKRHFCPSDVTPDDFSGL